MIGRLLCWLGIHRRPPGTRPEFAWHWACARCGQFVSGQLGRK